MVRGELVKRLVLRTISDDFENVDQVILRDVSKDGARCRMTIERSEIVDVLAGLIDEGLAKAYILSGFSKDPFSGELEGMPPMDVIEEDFKTYFYITKKGMEFHLSDGTWWPFDDEGDPR
jgi:hypothetical protein